MSRDVITVGSTMRIPLLYRGEYTQWRERFMNYLEEQTDGEAMLNSIQNGDQPLFVIAQVSLAGTAQNAPPTLKDPKFWTAEEKKTRKIDRLARSLLIQGIPNDIYSLIDSNESAKDLWDALERQMRGFEYGEQDRKAAILYEYETFKAIEGEQLLDTYLRYLQVINDVKKCGYKKDNCELNYKFLNNLQQEWKQYATLMRQTKNLMDINIDALYNIVTPSLSTEEPDNSLSMRDEHLNTILATESDEFIKSSVENLIPIPTLNNPTPYSDFMTKSFSTSLNSLLEETNSFDNSLPKFETFCFDVEEISSGSTTTRSDISLPEYEAFYDDHVKEISSGNTTTHSDSSLYDSFIFDLSINPFHLADMSDFYEFVDELIHIISSLKCDCFFFKIEPNSGDFTMDVVEDISPIREPRVHNALPTHPTLQLNLEFKLFSESLFTYVLWIFLPFLLYSVAPQYLLSLGIEDTIFDPGICNYHFLGQVYLIGVELSQDPKS
nr:hypothetical protein [Tanacetum cinerariifolium]